MRDLLREQCLETNCNKPAEFIIWGRLFPRASLGPRCYIHARKHINACGLVPESGYAVFMLDEAVKQRKLYLEDAYQAGFMEGEYREGSFDNWAKRRRL